MEADLCTRLVVDTTHNEEVIRQAGAVGLANALAENPDYVPAVLQQLMEVYEEKLYVSTVHLRARSHTAIAKVKVILQVISYVNAMHPLLAKSLSQSLYVNEP